MLALRQGVARLAPRPTQVVRTTRRYASGGAHHAQEGVNESIGTGLIITVSALPLGCLLYFVSRPGENGEAPALTRWINSYRNWNETWNERGALHAQAVQQAAHDRQLFLSAPRSGSHEPRYPEAFQSHSPRNIVAGSLVNMDAVTERYRRQHLEDEERKAKKLAAKAQAQE